MERDRAQNEKTTPEDELLHLFRIQLRKSEKLRIHFMEFERLEENHKRKAYRYLYVLAKRWCAQRRRDDVSAQHRSQSAPPGRTLTVKTENQTGICRDRRRTGRCANQAGCPWRHPEEVRLTGKGKKGNGQDKKGKGKGKGK